MSATQPQLNNPKNTGRYDEPKKDTSIDEQTNLQGIQSIFKLNFFCQEISSNSGFILVAKLSIHISEQKKIYKQSQTEVKKKLKRYVFPMSLVHTGSSEKSCQPY